MKEKSKTRGNKMKEKMAVLVGIVAVLLFALIVFCIPAHSTTFTFAWDHEDGAAGYKLYYGTGSKKYTASVDMKNPCYQKIVGDPKSWVCEFSYALPFGLNYVAATAYDAAGLESDYSNELTPWSFNLVTGLGIKDK